MPAGGGGLLRIARSYVRAVEARLRENPGDSEALFGRTVILAAQGRWEDAAACLDGLAHINPHFPGLWRFKARLYREMGDCRMERLCLVAANREELNEDARNARPDGSRRRPPRSRKAVRKLRVLAGVYARECVRRLSRDPRDPDALFVRAAILASIGRRGEAVASLDALTEVAPHYPGLWRFKARLYRDAGDAKMETLCSSVADHEDARAF